MEKENITTSDEEKSQKRGPKQTAKISFVTIRLIKAFREKKISAEQAAKEAGLSVPSFYRYSKLDKAELCQMARKTQYEAMTPQEQEIYDRSLKQHKAFYETMRRVHERQQQVKNRIEIHKLLSEAKYSKGKTKHDRDITLEKENLEHLSQLSEELLDDREMKCFLCEKIFFVHDKHIYAYKTKIANKIKYFCSRSCCLLAKKRYGAELKRAKK